MEKKLFGVTALFNTPDEIIKAAKGVRESGYVKYDVFTPYPIHGMDDAMKLKPSKLGYLTLGFGLTGTFIALFSMWFTMAMDYPMIIGGKPFFALPAFIPVTFELTVLLATLATVIGMLTFFFYFPNNSHPLHDTTFMKAVSHDRYGVCIESIDPKFDITKAKTALSGLGGYDIQEIYYPEKSDIRLFDPKFIVFLIVVAAVTSGAIYFALNKLVYMQPFTWMQHQQKLSAQAETKFFADKFSMRPKVEGTVARGYIPYEFKGLAAPTTEIVNPTFPSEKNLALGKKKFLTFCSPCHGNYGDGDSRLRGQFPNPPSLHSAKVRGWNDGNLYHVIVNGQNVMPSYESQILPEERWAIVNYIRVLQKAKNATLEDIQAVRKEGK